MRVPGLNSGHRCKGENTSLFCVECRIHFFRKSLKQCHRPVQCRVLTILVTQSS